LAGLPAPGDKVNGTVACQDVLETFLHQ